MKRTIKGPSDRALIVKSLFKNKLLLLFVGITLIISVAGILAPLIAPCDPYFEEPVNRLLAPSSEHLFGTDILGRDVFSRVLYGIRLSLFVGLLTSVISTVIGVVLGLLAGYFSMLDAIIMRICEAFSTIPVFLMAITLMTLWGISTRNVIISMSIVYAPLVITVTRGVALSIREQTYIEAMRAAGASWQRIVFGHMLPNVVSPIIVQMTYIFASSMLVEASLSFLGAGIPLPAPSLGNILNEAKTVIFQAWWLVIYPGLCLIFIMLGINVLGDTIRDVLDPLSN